MFRTLTSLATALLLMNALSGCSLPANWTMSQKPAASPTSTDQARFKQTAKPDRTAVLERQLKSLLDAGQYPAALQLLHRDIPADRIASRLEDEYLQTLNLSLRLAEQRTEVGDCGRAGELLQMILQSYPLDEALADRIDRSSAAIATERDQCSEELMESGLSAYRAGHFSDAIYSWEQILAYDPTHEAALQSIQTTRMQLVNLKSYDHTP